MNTGRFIDLVYWPVGAEAGAAPWIDLTLSPEELARAQRFAHAKDQNLYRTAHGLLRQILSRHASTAPADWRFDIAAHGKPILAPGQAELAFNLTHTDGLVAVAVSSSPAIGIDAESLDRRSINPDIGRDKFSASEIVWLNGHSASDRNAAFLRLWTAKEAFLKATGKGLTRRLSSFTVYLEAGCVQADDGFWTIVESRPTPRHFLAATVPGDIDRRLITIRAFDGAVI
jgi:4'-phosphopantetheinyl transferase